MLYNAERCLPAKDSPPGVNNWLKGINRGSQEGDMSVKTSEGAAITAVNAPTWAGRGVLR
jgi:hypothetical protein